MSWRGERLFVAAVFVVYAAVTLFVTLHHEPWRDEADPWLLMRDGGLSTMLARTGYVGVPAMWFLLIGPFATTGAPFVSQAILHLLLAWAAVLVFLIAAPLPRALKVLFVFSYSMSFEYAVIARPYVLTILFLFAAAASWRERFDRPLRLAIFVALLANSMTHGLLLAAILGALFLGECVAQRRLGERAIRVALVLMIVGGLLAAWQLRTPPDTGFPSVVRQMRFDAVPWSIGSAFFPTIVPRISFAGGLLILLLVTLAIGHRLVPLLFLWGSLGALLSVFVFVWVAGWRHSGLILLVVITALWIASAYGPPEEKWRLQVRTAATIALALALAFMDTVAVRWWIDEVRAAFSGAKEMAEYIDANGLVRYEIAAHNVSEAQALLPYLEGKQFWFPALGEHGSWMRWDRRYYTAIGWPYPVAVEKAREQLAGKQWLLLLNTRMPEPDRHGFRLLYTNRRPIFAKVDERYWLYAPLH